MHSNGMQWLYKASGSIDLHKQTSLGRKLSVQRQTKVKIHMSYVITFDIWKSVLSAVITAVKIDLILNALCNSWG